MTNEEILKKAISKGWNENEEFISLARSIMAWIEIGADIEKSKYYPLIFSHDFAKAFFGEKRKYYQTVSSGPYSDGTKTIIWNWQNDLQQMVLEENPLKYLEKFL